MTSTQVINELTLEILHIHLACGAPAAWVQAVWTARLEDTHKASDAENHDSKWQHPPAHHPRPRAQSDLLTQSDKGGHQGSTAALQRSNHQVHLQTKK